MYDMAKIDSINITPLSFLRACNERELQETWELLKRKEFAERIIVGDEPLTSEYMTEIQRICAETETPLKSMK